MLSKVNNKDSAKKSAVNEEISNPDGVNQIAIKVKNNEDYF